MEFTLTFLENAVARLEELLVRYEADPSDTGIRDGLIKRFEFTYEMCHKTLRRFLIETSASGDLIRNMPFSDLVRTGNDRGLLLSEWEVWKHYRDSRNATSHDYDESMSVEVVAGVRPFLADAQYLRDQIRRQWE